RRFGENLPRLEGDVETDLVVKSERTDRESPRGHRVVDGIDRGTLLEQERRLVHVRPQDAVDVETGRVVDDDGRLPDPLRVRVAGGDDPRRGGWGHDDL